MSSTLPKKAPISFNSAKGFKLQNAIADKIDHDAIQAFKSQEIP